MREKANNLPLEIKEAVIRHVKAAYFSSEPSSGSTKYLFNLYNTEISPDRPMSAGCGVCGRSVKHFWTVMSKEWETNGKQ